MYMNSNYVYVRKSHNKAIRMLLSLAIFALFLGIHINAYGQCGNLATKHLTRTAPNLLYGDDGTFSNGLGNWTYYKGCLDDSERVNIPHWNSGANNGNNPYLTLIGPHESCWCYNVNDPNTPGCSQEPSNSASTKPYDGIQMWYDTNYDNNGDNVGDGGLVTNRTHTVSVKLKSPTAGCAVTETVCGYEYTLPPPIVMIQLQGYDEDGYKVNDAQRNFRFSNAVADTWEEFSFHFIMPIGVTKVRIKIANQYRDSPFDEALIAHLDDIYIGEGVSYENEPTCKEPFNGKNTVVDELGNVYVHGEWFFPMIMHGDGYRAVEIHGAGNDNVLNNDNDPNNDEDDDGLKLYRNQGFNAMISGSGNYMIQDIVEAGLKPVLHLGWHYAGCRINPCIDDVGCDVAHDKLTDKLNFLSGNHPDNSTSYLDDLLFYYIDNEVSTKWNEIKEATDMVRAWEANYLNNDPNFEKIAPVYMLNGTMGASPKYLNPQGCRIGDITGTYISYGSKHPPNHRWTTLDHNPNQKMPTVIAQINGGTAVHARILGAIAHGARGMDFWRDYAPKNPNQTPANDITLTDWWNGFPDFVEKINNMKALIQQPHWTDTWGVDACVNVEDGILTLDCDASTVAYGTRELNGEYYLIVANYSLDNVDITFNMKGLPFNNANIIRMDKDFQEDNVATTMDNNTIIFNQFAGEGAEVYKIVGEACADPIVLWSDQDITVNTIGFDNNPSTTLTDPGTSNGAAIVHTTLEVWAVVDNPVQADFIEVSVTDPAGNNVPLILPASTAWYNNQRVRHFNIPLSNVQTTGSADDWTIQYSYNAQAGNLSYRVGGARLTYHPSTTLDAVQVVDDKDVWVDGNAANNGVTILDNAQTDVHQDNVILSNVNLQMYFLPVHNSCEEDIQIQLRDPANNVTTINPFEAGTCQVGTQGWVFVEIPVADVLLPNGSTAGWTIQYQDTDDQNAGAEYRMGAVVLDYDICDANCISSTKSDNTIDFNEEMLALAAAEQLENISIYPVPTRNRLNVDYEAITDKTVEIHVMSNDGKTAMRQIVNVSKGNNSITLQTGDLVAGYYYIAIYSTDGTPKLKPFVKVDN